MRVPKEKGIKRKSMDFRSSVLCYMLYLVYNVS